MRGTKAFKDQKKERKEEAKKRVRQGLTAWVASEDISSGFVVQEDEQGVGEGTEPPTWPGGRREREKRWVTVGKVTQEIKSALHALEKRLAGW